MNPARLGLRQLRPLPLSFIPRRQFTCSHIARDATVATPAPAKRPIGGIRGGIVGFLLGFSLAASFAAYNLLDEYQRASAALQSSVNELKESTNRVRISVSPRVTDQVKRISVLEKDMKALEQASASKTEVSRIRAEIKKVIDGLHVELLDLRSQLWGVQQDIRSTQKKVGAPSAPTPAVEPQNRIYACTLHGLPQMFRSAFGACIMKNQNVGVIQTRGTFPGHRCLFDLNFQVEVDGDVFPLKPGTMSEDQLDEMNKP
ncbi:hypothetical protein DL96DRAFT_1557673 [Flagelloscypha sp. PMI_526]|nr:hypothetical protein DL96DRAFT_1557673 [Flagelloscypha sp. PMI_526]